MKYRQLTGSMLFVGALGVFVPGCFGGNDESEGKICASPVEDGTYCVPSSSGPAGAWNDAKAMGSEPIQMWAVWPDNIELKDVVANPYQLDAWLDDVRTLMDYLRVTQGNAESYHASLAGKLGDDLRRAREVQNGIIDGKTVDPGAVVATALAQKAIQETDPLKVEIAADKQTLGEVQALMDQAKVGAAPFAAQYTAIMDSLPWQCLKYHIDAT